MSTAYVTDMLKLYGMETSKPSPTTGSSTVSKVQPEPLDRNEHKKYRAIVGKLLWLALIRPDISYATKELSRDLTAPTTESITKVKHLLRYIAGTKDYCQRLLSKCDTWKFKLYFGLGLLRRFRLGRM